MIQPLTADQRRQCRTLFNDLDHSAFRQVSPDVKARHAAMRASLGRLADGGVPTETDLHHLVQALQLAEGIIMLAQEFQAGPRLNRAARRARR